MSLPAHPYPDLSALEQVRRRLWEGRAVAFVGAGVSRSATPKAPGVPPFPLWADLAVAMRADLYPGREDRAPQDALRLAQEYEQMHGGNELHRLITRLVPDGQYDPGPNHVNLLALPWADVLTTNYDTLLERAARSSGRRYDPVYRVEDLTRTGAPRIVKLHGSLPSHTPLIITEEHFRRYPQTHAPFVSLARTRLAEHAVLLLGFSGDDPNFLSWTGWVRDHLSEDAPRLYLAGLLDLPHPKRSLLEHRGVAPLDLAPLFPEAEWPDGHERHAAALQWLLAALADARPPDPLQWPGPYTRTDEPPQLPTRFPPLPPSPHPRSQHGLGDPFAFGRPVTVAETLQGRHADRKPLTVLAPWRAERERYPGWVTPPREVRDRLWRETERWKGVIVREITSIEPPDDLLLLRELAWRLDRALLPLLHGDADAVLRTLARYNPAPHLVNVPTPVGDGDPGEGAPPESAGEGGAPAVSSAEGAASLYTPGNQRAWDWARLSEAWVELALSVLRSLRERGDEARFEAWRSAVEPLVGGRPAWAARLAYEAALFGLAQLDRVAVERALTAWPSTLDGHPFGEVHRAAVLAERGDLDQAARTAEDALGRILDAQATGGESIALRSQEGWTRALLHWIRVVTKGYSPQVAVREQPEGWRRSLAPLGCDPYALLNPLAEALKRPPPTLEWGGVVETGFDPGRYSRHYGSSGLNFADLRPALEYLRMREEGASPIRIGRFNINGGEVVQAAGWVRPLVPNLGYAVPLRSAAKETEAIFSRPRVAGLDPEHALAIYDWVLRGVNGAAVALAGGPHLRQAASARLVGLVPVLSRLVVRMDDGVRGEALDLAIRLARSPVVHEDWSLYKAVGTLIERAARYASPAVVRSRMADLMALPLDGRDLPSHGTTGRWFEPAELLPSLSLDPADVRADTVAGLLLALRQQAPLPLHGGRPESERRIARTFAAARLRYLYARGALTDEQARAFAEAYWEGTGDEGVPESGWHSPAFALDVPPPPSGLGRADRVRRALLAQPLGHAADGAVGSSGAGDLLIGPIRQATAPEEGAPPARSERIAWTAEEAAEILRRLAAWWDADGAAYRRRREEERDHGVSLMSAADFLDDQLRSIPLALRDVVLPRLADPARATEALRVLEEMRDTGFAVAIAYPDLLRHGITPDVVATRVREDLTAQDSWAVEHGAWAVHRWLRLSGAGGTPPPEDLLTELVALVAARRRPGLASVLGAVAAIASETPGALTPAHASRLATALEYLRHETAPPAEIAWFAPEIGEAPEPHHKGERAAAATLAHALSGWFVQAGEPAPEEVGLWRTLAASDPMPEVRAAWRADGDALGVEVEPETIPAAEEGAPAPDAAGRGEA